jgi:hypothetical protein
MNGIDVMSSYDTGSCELSDPRRGFMPSKTAYEWKVERVSESTRPISPWVYVDDGRPPRLNCVAVLTDCFGVSNGKFGIYVRMEHSIRESC